MLHELEELDNVMRHQPLHPGETIAHATAYACEQRGWIRRNSNGDWVPTDEGLLRWSAYQREQRGLVI